MPGLSTLLVPLGKSWFYMLSIYGPLSSPPPLSYLDQDASRAEGLNTMLAFQAESRSMGYGDDVESRHHLTCTCVQIKTTARLYIKCCWLTCRYLRTFSQTSKRVYYRILLTCSIDNRFCEAPPFLFQWSPNYIQSLPFHSPYFYRS